MTKVEVTTKTYRLLKRKKVNPFIETYTINIYNPNKINVINGIKRTVKEFNLEEKRRKKIKKDYPVSLRAYGELISYKVFK